MWQTKKQARYKKSPSSIFEIGVSTLLVGGSEAASLLGLSRHDLSNIIFGRGCVVWSSSIDIWCYRLKLWRHMAEGVRCPMRLWGGTWLGAGVKVPYDDDRWRGEGGNFFGKIRLRHFYLNTSLCIFELVSHSYLIRSPEDLLDHREASVFVYSFKEWR